MWLMALTAVGEDDVNVEEDGRGEVVGDETRVGLQGKPPPGAGRDGPIAVVLAAETMILGIQPARAVLEMATRGFTHKL